MSFPFDWRQLDCPEIKRVALCVNDVDNFFTDIENLYEELSSLPSEKIKFNKLYEIALALLMLADGILPPQSYPALAKTFLKAFDEIEAKKYTVEALYIKPPKRGRTATTQRDRWIIDDVAKLKLEGLGIDDAYVDVADKFHLSKDTIRRIYERANKARRKKGFKELP